MGAPIAVLAQSYCQPIHISGGLWGDYIDGFQLGSIDNMASGYTDYPGYTDFTQQGEGTITRLAPGSTYTATIVSGSDAADNSYAIWVDLDHDLVLEDSERVAHALASGTGPGVITTLSVTIPGDALPGYTRLRVVCCGIGSIAYNACDSYIVGETEDYTVVIDDGAPCIPLYGYGTTQEDFISNVTIGSIYSNTSAGATPYSDLTHAGPNSITSLTPDVNTLVIITTGTHYSTEDQPNYYSVWVDLDQNGSFAFTERLALTSSFFPGEVLLSNLVIPPGTPNGYTRMRVMCTFDTIPIDACDTYGYGETEDYTVVIDDGQTCIPLYAAQASQGNYVTDVQLEGLHWTSPNAPASGYTDATEYGAHLQSGATSTLTMFGGPAASGYLSAWVDWGNNVFQPIGSLPVGTGFAQVSFDITPDPDYVGYARLRVAHTDANVAACDPSDFGSAVDFTLSVGRNGWPCLPLQGYGTQLGDGFTDLTLEGTPQATQPAFPYYDWSSSTPYHYQGGGSITINFTAGQYAPETYRLSMDMNDDGDFFDTNEEPLIYTSTVAGEPITMVYPLPPNCLPGQHFMRLRANDEANYPLVDPCDDQLYGQLFDWVVVVEEPAGPCIPFMEHWTTDGDYIDGVQLGTIQNTGTGSAFGAAYQDYTAQSTTIAVGQPATLTITGGEYAGDTYSAWIDYNADNDFDDANELLGWIGIVDPFGTNDLPFTVPPGTTLGNKRMRVRCDITPLSDACSDDLYGETEDYTVNIEVNTGIDALSTADFSLRPMEDGVQLLTPASLIGNSYLLLDATGRMLATGRITADRTDLSMSAFAKGAYTVQLSQGGEHLSKRFLW